MRKGSLIVILGLAFLLITISTASQQQSLLSESSQVTLGQSKDESPELLQCTAGGQVLGFRKGEMFVASGDHALRVEFVNARPVSPGEEAKSRVPESIRPAAQPLGKVSYPNLWDGVTLVYENHGSGVVKSTYRIEPVGNSVSSPLNQIRLRYNVPVKADDSGGLVFSFATGEMRESRPVAWQEIEGKRVLVDLTYRLRGEQEVGFKAGSYDPRYPLVIDPVLSWNTFLGGSKYEGGRGIAVDTSGNVYVAGYSNWTWGSPIRPYLGGADAFVAKLNGSGALQWNTFLGGTGGDGGNIIAVDASGNVYVTGDSSATWGSPVLPFRGGGQDAFVAKLNGSGALQWNTFLGGSGYDHGWGLAVDTSGNVYVEGDSRADWYWSWPVRPFAGGYSDVFVAKLNGSGALLWNTFLGSSSTDYGWGIGVDASENVYVTGYSYATWGSPVRPYTGDYDAFAAKLNGSGALQWNTFLGSSSTDYGLGIAVDTSGNVYVAGSSYATWGSPVRPHDGPGYMAFVAKLNNSGALQWNTFMGNEGYGLAVDTNGNVYVVGSSNATWGSPVRPFAGGTDAFAAKLNGNGALQWNAFLGGSGNDFGFAIAVDSSGNVYVTGDSYATWGSPVRPYSGGDGDAFVAKISCIAIIVFHGHDFNGNGSSDVAVFRPAIGKWYLKDIGTYTWGGAGDMPVNGDYDKDGKTDIAAFRPAAGKWCLKYSGGGTATIIWGGSSDIPVPGDYDGDNKTDIAVWNPAAGKWYVKYSGGGTATVTWGGSGDIPVPGDYDGDGKTDIAAFRTAAGKWNMKYSGGGTATVTWGGSSDIPVPGDYDGDGKTDIAIWGPYFKKWYVKYSGGGTATVSWGGSSDIPVPGDYDGDDKTDIAVFRPATGKWYLKYSGGGTATVTWGGSGDIPLVR